MTVGAVFLAFRKGCFRDVLVVKTQREAFGEKLKIENEELSRSWLSEGEEALRNPVRITSPYSETGSFDGIEAIALEFAVVPGRRVQLDVFNAGSHKIFSDLFRLDSSGPQVLIEADTSATSIITPTVLGGRFLLRMQPQPGYKGFYKLTLSTSPLISWPVKPGVPSRIGSYWGADREGGKRSHQGVDIFAKKGSLLVAAADGYVDRVEQNKLGGKVIFLRPDDLPVALYYAHLDSQMVSPGSRVRKGDVIGTMGNTGNARNTPAHLHFGVYSKYGAVDPLGFLQKESRPSHKNKSLPGLLKTSTSKRVRLFSIPDPKVPVQWIPRADSIFINASTGDFFRVATASGKRGFILASDF